MSETAELIVWRKVIIHVHNKLLKEDKLFRNKWLSISKLVRPDQGAWATLANLDALDEQFIAEHLGLA